VGGVALDRLQAAKINASIASKPIAKWFGDDANIGTTVASYVSAADSHDKLRI
jgi:endoglucanase